MYKIGFMGMLDCSFQFNLSNDMKTNKVHWQQHLKTSDTNVNSVDTFIL